MELDLIWIGLGIAKEDAKHLIDEHPKVSHLYINDKVYYPKAKSKCCGK